MATLERRITELEKQYGMTDWMPVLISDDTDEEEKERIRKKFWPANVTFVTEDSLALG